MSEDKKYMDDNKNHEAGQDDEMEIDLMELARKLWSKRKFLIKMGAIGMVVGIIIALSIPKQYTVQMTLSPEAGKDASKSSLAGMASMLGMGGMSMGSDNDALNVLLFPEIISSTPFILELFDTKVEMDDKGAKPMPLSEYLEEQKSPWWGTVMAAPGMAIGLVKSIFDDSILEEKNAKIDPFRLTKKESAKVEALKKSLTADVDKKTGVTTVTVTLQDPLVAAQVADTVIAKLQQYITAYRVSKAKDDCNYLEKLYSERQKDYYTAQQNYAQYLDANKSVILQSVLTERERLMNEMNLAYQVYSQVATQLQMARAKVQEAKPVFAIVEPATVPLKPSGTSRMMIMVGFIFLAVAGAGAWVLFGADFYGKMKTGFKSEGSELEK